MRRLIPLILLCSAIMVILIEGCSVHQIRSAPIDQKDSELPGAFATQAPGATDVTADKWWLVFQDETLNGLMESCFEGNLDLAQYVARLQQALATGRQRSAERLPNVNLKGSASRSQQVIAAGETTGNAHAYSVAAGYEVDLWNKVASRARAQELETSASREQLHALYLTLSAQVAENYFAMVEQRSKLILIQQTIAARSDNLALVTLRYREGMVSALDLYQARQNLANARSQEPVAQGQLALTAHALAVLTGGYPTDTVGGTLAELPDVPEAFPLGLPSGLLQQRPDIQAGMLRLAAADHQIAAAVADRFPTINLLADYGHSESDFGTVISGTVWNLIGNLTLPLLDFGKRKAEVERNKAVYAERLAAYRQTVLTAFQEVEDALVSNRTSKNAIVRISTEAVAAEDALRLSKAEYTDGLSTYLPVLTAQTIHFDSQTRLLSARRQLLSARISLARALGGSWMVALADDKLHAARP
jgi:NodT family efflux transporter outer membrane factor (OMF) lipoprotein